MFFPVIINLTPPSWYPSKRWDVFYFKRRCFFHHSYNLWPFSTTLSWDTDGEHDFYTSYLDEVYLNLCTIIFSGYRVKYGSLDCPPFTRVQWYRVLSSHFYRWTPTDPFTLIMLESLRVPWVTSLSSFVQGHTALT